MSTEVASLKIKVDTSDTVKATNDLNKLTNTAKSTEKQTQSLTSAFFSLKGAIATLGVAQTAQYFIKTADAMNLLNARLKLTTSSMEEFNSQQKQLLAISLGSHTALSDTITLYTKLDPALKQIGATTSQVNTVVDSFSKGLQLGGASAQESSSAILQFAQAMGSGVLRGEEFNAMAEASPKLLKYLADGLGVPQTALRKMAEAGELTALRVSNALLKMKSDIDRDFVTLPLTVGKATTDLMTMLSLGIDDINNAFGITNKLALLIQELTNNIGGYTQTIITTFNDANKYINEHNEFVNTAVTVTKMLGESAIAYIAIAEGLTKVKLAIEALKGAVAVFNPIIAVVALAGAALFNTWIEGKRTADNLSKSVDDLAKSFSKLDLQKRLVDVDKELSEMDKRMKGYSDEYKLVSGIADAYNMKYKEKQKLEGALSEIDNKNKKSTVVSLFENVKTLDLINGKIKRNEEEIIKISGSNQDKFNLQLSENIKKLEQNGASELEIKKYTEEQKQAFSDKQNKDEIQASEKKQKELERLEKEHQENIKKVTQDAKDMITSDVQKLADEYVKMYEVVKDTLSPDELNALNAAYQKKAEDLTGVTELLKQAQEIATSEIDKINDKYLKMYEVIKNNPMFDEEKMKLFYESWNKEIENTKEKLDYGKSIKLDTEGDNRAVAKITKGFDELNDATKQYHSNRAKATKGSKEEAENEEQYRKDQINGYANISSAMADMFEKGSKEAATFQAASTALALVEATRAILTQGTGDPYTAIPRMVAMAAMVGSLMKNIGVAFGMNKTTTSSDAFSAQSANTGTGSVLGDTKKASDSISNSLSILEDFAKPNFRLATSMDESLKSIDSKIGGVTSLLIQNSATALGTNYTGGYDTGFKNNLGFNNTLSTLGVGAAGLSIAGATGGFGAMGALSVAGPAGLALLGIDKLLLGGATSNIIGGAFNSVLGGLFGKTSVSKSLKDSGITFADAYLKDAVNQLNGQVYQTISTTTTKKSWFSSSSSTSISTYFSALDKEISNQFSLVLGNIYDTVYQAGIALNLSSSSLESSLNSFIVSIGKISLKDKTGTQIEELLTNVFSGISDKLAKAVVPALSEFQAVGEGMYETLIRVATGMEQANYYIGRLGSTFETIDFTDIINKQGVVGFEALYQSILKVEKGANFNYILSTLSGTAEELYSAYIALDLIRDRLTFFGKGLDSLSASMIGGAGSLESLSDGIQSYIENFYSDTEQQALKISELTQLLNRAGISEIPTSISGFRKLIESIDTTTESGQYLYGNLISLSGAFSDVYSEIDSQRTSLLSDITNFVKELRGTTSSLNAGTTFKTFADSFNLMIDAINNGSSELDSIGATTLTTAQSYLDTVARTATSAADLKFAQQIVANKLESVATAPNINLGTINDTLKISFNENSVIVNELKQMRTQLEYLNGLNTTQTATQLKTLSATRALIS